MGNLHPIHTGASLAPKVESDGDEVDLSAVPELPRVKHEDIEREPAQDRAAPQPDRNIPEGQQASQANSQRSRNQIQPRVRNWNRTGARGQPRNTPNARRHHDEPTVAVRRMWRGRRIRVQGRYISATGDIELRPTPSSYALSSGQLVDVSNEICAEFNRQGLVTRPMGLSVADLVARSYRTGRNDSLIILPLGQMSRSLQIAQTQNEINYLMSRMSQLSGSLALAVHHGRFQDADRFRGEMADITLRLNRYGVWVGYPNMR